MVVGKTKPEKSREKEWHYFFWCTGTLIVLVNVFFFVDNVNAFIYAVANPLKLNMFKKYAFY